MSLGPSRKYRPIGFAGMFAALCLLAVSAPRAGTITLFGPQTLTRTTGSPNVFTFSFVTGPAIAPYVLHIDNHGVTSGVVTLNGVQILGPNDFKGTRPDDWKKGRDWDDDDWDRDAESPADRGNAGTDGKDRKDGDGKDRRDRTDEWRGDHDWKGVIERTVTLRPTGSNSLRIELRSKPGTHVAVTLYGAGVPDTTPPAIAAIVTPAPNGAGWNRTDVQVSFVCSDAGSGIATCSPAQTVTTSGANQIVRGTATDLAGNTSVATASVSIDKAAPLITSAISPAPNAAGWLRGDATVTFACADPGGSGVASCSPPATRGEGAAQAVAGTAEDIAGNPAATTATVSVDKTPPTITASVLPAPNASGWIDADATVTFACTDTLSGIASCPSPIVITAEGTQTRSGITVDRAGNDAAASVTVNIVKSRPSISATVSPLPNANGWHRTAVLVTFTCGSGGAGAVSCPPPVSVTTEGAGQVITRSVTDAAGQTAEATVTLNIDRTTPTVAAAVSPTPAADGSIDSDATITFTCADALSAIASCPPPIAVTAEGVQTFTGTATDRAGNDATTSVTINVVKTRPTITATVTPPPNANGWQRTDVAVAFACTGSGTVSCPATVIVTTEGANQAITRSVTDAAGHSADATVVLNIDKTAPVIAGTATPPANGAGWHRAEAAVGFACSDVLSGVETCPSPIAVATEGAAQRISGTVTDRAGNTAVGVVTLNIDTTPPVVTIASPLAGAALTTSPAALSGTASDLLSGLASVACNGTVVTASALSCAPVLAVGDNTLTLSATDAAGNVATAQVTVTYTLANRPPVANAGVSYPGLAGTAIFFSAAGSSDPDGDAITLAWDFGDGAHGTGMAPAHTYATASTYSVTLTATDSRGASSSATATAIVSAANRRPTANAGGPYAGSVGIPIAFVASASDSDGDPLSYQWNFGDATSGTGAAVTHTYQSTGTYAVTVTVSDGRGGTAGASAQAVVIPPNRPPTVAIGGPFSGVNGSAIAFGATGVDPDGDVLSYAWNFGDGGSGAGAQASHTFAATGTFPVSVTVTDGRGGTATASSSAVVAPANRAPHAAAGGPYSGEARVRMAFSAAASADPDADTLTYAWDFGDGTSGAGVSPNHGYAAAGSYTARVTVEDGRGGRDVASASVVVTAVPPPVNQPPIARPGGPYDGEAARVLAFNGSASSDPDGDVMTFDWDFGDGGHGAGAAPFHQYAAIGSFTITLTVGDGHGHTNAATTSVTIAPAADRAPPSLTISAPAKVLPGTEVIVTAAAADNVGVASVTFEIDGAPPVTITSAPYQRAISIPDVAAPGATIEVRVTAVDAAGNAGHAQATITIDATPDTERPTVALKAPAEASAGGQIHLSAIVSDNVGVASVEFRAADVTIATAHAAPYEATYGVRGDAAAGSLVSITARATDFTGNTATATVAVLVVQNTDTTPPAVTLSVPPAAAPDALLRIIADATDDGGVSGVSFFVEGVRIATVAQAPYLAAFAVPATAAPGSILHVEARASDYAGLEGRAVAETIVVAAEKAFVIGEVFDDATGRLLEGAVVMLTGTDTAGRRYSDATVTDARGRFLIRAAAGAGVVTVRHAGMTPVDRPVDLLNGAVIEVLDSRLSPLAAPVALSGVLGGTAATAVATLTVPAGVAADALALTLTAVSPQGLQGSLPAGWSPVSALDIGPHGVALGGATFAVPNAWHFRADTPLVIAHWDEDASAWRALADAVISADGGTIRGSIETTGAFAVLVGDVLPSAPGHPPAGALLTGVIVAAIPPSAVSFVNPTPKVLFYSPGVKSAVDAVVSSAAPLSSGTVAWARMTESYRFLSGSEIHPEPYTADLVLYQRASDPASPIATYAVSPSLTFEPLSLKDGVISVELFARPDVAAPIGSIGPDGGVLTAPTGESIQVPPGAVPDATPLRIAGIAAGELGVPMPDGFDLLGAMRVTFSGTLAHPGIVSVAAPASLGDTTGILLVRLQELEGATRLLLVGIGRVAGDRVVSELSLTGSARTFEGVRVAGRYAFVHTSASIAYAAGTTIGIDGAPFTGALVATPAMAVGALSRGAAGYIAVGGVGATTFTATDLVRADAGSGSLTFTRQDEVLPLDLQLVALPPRVTAILPSNGSTNVAPSTAIVITFSEPIDPASISGAQVANIVLAAADGHVVPATLVLSANDSVATLRPAAVLAENTEYTAIVAAGVTDRSGYALGAPFSATFTTLDTLPPPPPPAGAITAGIPVNGAATIHGTQGTAGAHDRVTIVNLTTGQISPVLLDANGGFTTTVAAGIRDRLQLRIVDAAGNTTTVDLPRFSQANADGSVSTAIGPEGGRVTGASGEFVDVRAGTFPAGAVVTVQMIAEADFPLQLTERDRRTFSFTAGVRIDFGGATPQSYVNVGIPARGGETEDDQWVVTEVVANVVGATRLNVVDTARLIDAHIRTSSPPCPGVTGAGTYGFLRPGRPVGVLFGPLDRGLPAAIFAPFLVPGMISLDVSADSLWGAYDSINGVVDSIAPYVANAQDIVTALTGPNAYTCLPTLSGSVTVSANRVKLEFVADEVQDTDVEIVVANLTRGGAPTRVFRPFGATVIVAGSDSDAFEVRALDYQGASRVIVTNTIPHDFARVEIAGLAPGDSRVVVRNETRDLTVSVPYNSVSGVSVVHLLIEGSASDDEYSAEIRGAAPRSVLPVVTPYPFSSGPLIAHGVFGAIDPTLAEIQAINATLPPEKKIPENGVRWVALRNLTETAQRALAHLPPLDLTILDTDAGVIGTVVGGAFEFAFDGKLTDTYEVKVYYNNGREEAVTVPNFHISVTDPRTHEVVRRVSGQTPPRGTPVQIDLGPPGVGPASLAFTASALTRVDPTLPIALEFSGALDQASVTASMAVYDDVGTRVAGQWVLTNGGRTAVFNADAALQHDARYHVVLSGVRDAAGRPLAATTLPFTTFKPERLGRLTLDTEGVAIAVKDIAFIRQVASPNDRWLVAAVSGNLQGNKLHTIDVTDPVAPTELGHTAGGSYKRRVTLAQTEANYINYEVPLVPQTTGMSCWAASFAMVVGWADQQAIDPSQIAASLGYWYQYRHGLDGYDRDMLTEWHMVPEPPQSYSVAKFRDLLEQYGPLWVTTSVPSVHTRVITGMFGDGTPDGTMLLFNDPWEEGMREFTPSNRGSQYSRTFSRFATEMESLVPIWNRVNIRPFLQAKCDNGDIATCNYIHDPINSQNIDQCTAGDPAACVRIRLPNAYGVYVAHLASKPAWVPPPVTSSLTVGTPVDPSCSAHVAGSVFTGDLAVSSSWNVDDTYLTFFDVTDPVNPCVVGGKLLTANPERLNAFTEPGTVHISGSARGVATIRHDRGFAAYVAESDAGVFAADIGKNIPEPTPADRKPEGAYSGDVMDVATFRNRVLALNNNYGGDASLDVLTADLSPVASVPLGTFDTLRGDSKVHRLVTVRQVPIDRDLDGVIDSDERFDLAFAGGGGGVTIIDISDLDDPRVIGRVPLPGIIRELDVDDTGRVLLAGGDRTKDTNGDEAIFLITLADPFAAPIVDPTTGRDTRVSFVIPYPGGVSGFKVDSTRGRVYVGWPGVAPNSGGVDVWAFTKRGMQNRAPIGVAGSNQTVAPASTVRLDGTGSSDPDGDTLTYEWTQIAGDPVTLSDPTAQAPLFAAPDVDSEVLVFSLVVRDGSTVSRPSIVTITVQR